MEIARQTTRNPDDAEPDSQDAANLVYKCATEATPIHNFIGKDTEMIVNMRNSMPEQNFLDTMGAMLLPELEQAAF